MTDPSSRQFDIEIEIAAPRDAVFKALTDSAELTRWFAPQAKIDAKVGGEIIWSWGDLYTWPQRIEILEPGARLRTRYQSSVADAVGTELKAPLFVDFFLEGEGGMTTLRLCHSGFGADASFDEEYDGISKGWPVELRSLRLYLEKHLGENRRIAWSTLSTPLSRQQTWEMLTGKDGFACGAEIQDLQEGASFRIADIEGEALRCNPFEFTAVASSHNDGFLRISLEQRQGETLVWIWLATYGEPAARVDALQKTWDTMLQRLFAANGETASTAGS